MKNRFYHIILILFLLIFACKKTESATIKNNNDNTDKDTANTTIKELVGKLGGGTPKEQVKMKDAEIISTDNKIHRLSDYKEKIIMLNLWATWCPPCRAEMPSMEKLYNDFKNKNFIIIAISLGEDLSTVNKFLKKNQFSFPIFIDNKNEVAQTYSTGSIPTTYLIDKEGNIIARFIGGVDWYSTDSIKLIDALLK